jgi:hypothetical protein
VGVIARLPNYIIYTLLGKICFRAQYDFILPKIKDLKREKYLLVHERSNDFLLYEGLVIRSFLVDVSTGRGLCGRLSARVFNLLCYSLLLLLLRMQAPLGSLLSLGIDFLVNTQMLG